MQIQNQNQNQNQRIQEIQLQLNLLEKLAHNAFQNFNQSLVQPYSLQQAMEDKKELLALLDKIEKALGPDLVYLPLEPDMKKNMDTVTAEFQNDATKAQVESNKILQKAKVVQSTWRPLTMVGTKDVT